MIIFFLTHLCLGDAVSVPFERWGTASQQSQTSVVAAPNTTITSPSSTALSIRQGSTVNFEATASGDSSNLTLFWEFCPDESICRFQGEQVSYTFEEAGVFDVVCYAVDEQGIADPSPARVRVQVHENNVPPSGKILTPSRREFTVRQGTEIEFRGVALDADSESVRPTWRLLSNPDQVAEGPLYKTRFTKLGIEVVGFAAVDSDGDRAIDYRVVHVIAPQQNIPPTAEITAPRQREIVMVNEPVELSGLFEDADVDPLQIFWWTSDGQRRNGRNPLPLVFSRPGRYQITTHVADGKGGFDRQSTVVVVVDLDARPEVVIVKPRVDIRIEPDQPIYLEGKVKDASFLERHFVWAITDLSNDATRILHQETPGWVKFPAGAYSVTLAAVHPFRDDAVIFSEPRQILVRSVQEGEFNDADRPERAATISDGTYSGISLGDGRFFKLPSTLDHQDLQIHLAAGQQLRFQVLRNGNLLREGHVPASGGNLQFRSLTRGDLILGVLPSGTQSKDLDFGMGVQTLNPAIYLTDVSSDAVKTARLGLVNPFTTIANAECIAYDSQGAILEKVQLEIPPMGRCQERLDVLFSNPAEIAWVRVDANQPIQGFSLVESYDRKEAYAVSGVGKLSSDVLVPHIAERTEQWYTRAHVVNGSAGTVDAMLVAGSSEEGLDNRRGYSTDRFDFVEKLGGTIPVGSESGSFSEISRQISLAGSEVFGKVDGNRQVAGLTLNDGKIDNPNFFATDKILLFTHIARDVAQFWTGLAMVNFSSEPRNLQLIAFGSGGIEVGRLDLTLSAGEKLVDTADSLLGPLGGPAAIDWLEVHGAEDVVGYELFGTIDNKRLAGFEAGPQVNTRLCFPHVDAGVGQWHGISLVNVNEAPITASLTLYSDGGQVLGETSKVLAAKEKWVALLTDVFGTLPLESGWVEAESDANMAGFLLFGDQQFEAMSAVRAE